MKHNKTKKLLSPGEVKELLGLSYTSILQLGTDGILKCHTMKKRQRQVRKYDAESVNSYIKAISTG